MTRAALGALLIALALGSLSACSREVEVVGPGEASGAALPLPTQLVGLTVQPEAISPKDLEKIDRPYVDSLAVFGLRDGELLRATLQVARFNSVARPEDSDFRRSIIGVIGGRTPFELNVGGQTVNATTGTSQSIFSWFEGRGMFVLSIQQDYEFPRTLLRRLIDLDLEL